MLSAGWISCRGQVKKGSSGWLLAIVGGAGNDTLYGGPGGGDDVMAGGLGNDRLFGGRTTIPLTAGPVTAGLQVAQAPMCLCSAPLTARTP
ncbi:MAG: hypothetical protein OXE42_13925 [Gammaproteobacteria bacterium]|nr:hypothetical protein [Gammaproteobacteria bacterium]